MTVCNTIPCEPNRLREASVKEPIDYMDILGRLSLIVLVVAAGWILGTAAWIVTSDIVASY